MGRNRLPFVVLNSSFWTFMLFVCLIIAENGLSIKRLALDGRGFCFLKKKM